MHPFLVAATNSAHEPGQRYGGRYALNANCVTLACSISVTPHNYTTQAHTKNSVTLNLCVGDARNAAN